MYRAVKHQWYARDENEQCYDDVKSSAMRQLPTKFSELVVLSKDVKRCTDALKKALMI